MADDAAKAITNVMERFAFESNAKFDVIGTGGLFEIKAHGDYAHHHQHRNRILQSCLQLAEKDADLESMLDLMIFNRWSEYVDAPERSQLGAYTARNFGSRDFRWFMAELVEGVKSMVRRTIRYNSPIFGICTQFDITAIEGFYELFDNAFDADATEIRAHIEKKENGNLRFYIIDNGRGIPTTHTDDNGVMHQGIPYILAYGGSIPHPGRELSRSIGKFGVGLSQTASCLSTRTEVYTKNSNDEEWRYGYYDFEELFASEDCTLEPETTKRPPWIDLPETGTILDDVDKVAQGTPDMDTE